MLVTVRIPKWNEYNPRKDGVVYAWFRMQTNFFSDQRVFGLTDSEKLTFLFLLCEVGKRKILVGEKPGWALISLPYSAAILQRPAEEIESNIKKIESISLIETDLLRSVPQMSQDVSLRDVTERDETKRNEDGDTRGSKAESSPIGSEAPIQPELIPMKPVVKKPTVAKPKSPTKGAGVWIAYSDEYRKLYGHAPVANAMQNSMCCQLVDRLGAEEAPLVARFYVKHRKTFYVNGMHALKFCIYDCEKLRTEWASGRVMTDKVAREAGLAQANIQAGAEFLEELKGESGDGR